MANDGFGCIGSVNSIGHLYTFLDNTYRITNNGNITSWCIYAYSPGNVKLKIYRGNPITGATKVFDSGFKEATTGINNFTANIPVITGDYIAFIPTAQQV